MIAPVPGLSIEQQPESIVMVMLAYGEARGEGPRGINAVLHVCRNRALHADTTFKHEALRKAQFSCFNDNDPNRPKLLTAWTTDPITWAICDAVCALFEAGDTIDPTNGARFYFVTNMPDRPSWGPGDPSWKELAVIGNHTFGNTA